MGKEKIFNCRVVDKQSKKEKGFANKTLMKIKDSGKMARNS